MGRTKNAAHPCIRRLADSAGAFTCTIGNILDVTKAVAQEDVAQQDVQAASEDRFRRIAESAPVGIFRANSDGKLTYVNATWANKAGMTAEEMLGDGWLSAITDLSSFTENPAWADFGVGEIRHRTLRLRTIGSNELWMEIVTSAEFDSSGVVQGFTGVAIDITEQRRAYEELAKRDEELSLLASNATDAILRLSLDGICKYASPSAHKLFGVPAESLKGVNLITRFHPDEREEVEATFSELREGKIDQRLVAFRSERLDAPGQYVWLEANCGLVLDAKNAPMEIIASIRNISERKAFEEALFIARNSAETAAHARSTFLANMSHEIRTPMNGVIGFTEVLLADKLSDEQRLRVELIAESGRAMLGLLNDILDMSKIEAGQMTLAPAPLDVRHMLNSVTRMLRPAAEDKGLRVETLVSDDLPELMLADPLRLRQILLNLLSNAIKFTERGHIRINAFAEEDHNGHQIAIVVEDSGIGIAADRLKAIFAPFTQAEDSTSNRFGGTGLGLAISQELARLMGGLISVTSNEGVGTAFKITLPLTKAERLVPVGPQVAKPVEGVMLSDIRLLVAEDNDINQQLMRDMAAKIGVEIAIASDGESTIDMVRRAAWSGHPFAMVLMDLRMPGMGGLEATQRLREVGFSPEELPVIALTANAFQDDIDTCLAAGMQGHLAKPLRLEELTEAIQRFAKPPAGSNATKPTRSTVSSPSRENGLTQRYMTRKKDVFTQIAMLAQAEIIGPAQVKELVEMLHKLAGTAGAFGEEKLGDATASLEQALRSAGPNQIAAIIDNAELLLSRAG